MGFALAVALHQLIASITPAQAVTQLPPNAIIVDDGDAGFERFGTPAFWQTATSTPNDYFNGDMTWTSNYNLVIDNYARWSLPVTATLPMTYEVYAFVPRYNSSTTNATYTISRGGLTTTRSINQNNVYADWVSLGKHAFSSAGPNYVSLSDATGEPVNTTKVGFDAIAFVPQTTVTEPPVTPPVTPTPPATPIFTPTAFVHMPLLFRGIAVPAATTSRYISTIDPERHYNMGCETGRRGESGMLVLEFGQPIVVGLGYGASIYSSFVPASTAQVAEAAKGYLRGYAECSSTQRLQVGLGINNYKGETNANHGAAWARMVTSVNDWLRAQPFANRISVAGATDAEPSWNTAGNTRTWVDGFVGNTTQPLINFGSCDGCPTALRPNQQPNNGWTVDDVWYISAGAPNTLALPEIYLTGGIHADQWYRVSLRGYTAHGKRIDFAGTLTQFAACQERGCAGTDNTPAQGWSQLRSAVNADIRTATSVPWSSDITWRQDDDSFAALGAQAARPFTAPAITHQVAGAGYIVDDVTPPLPATRFLGNNAWVGQAAHVYAGLIRAFDKDGNETAQGGLVVFPVVNGEVAGDAVFYPAPTATGALRVIAAEGDVLVVQSDAGVLRFDVAAHAWQ
jgi:hypothetical protein